MNLWKTKLFWAASGLALTGLAFIAQAAIVVHSRWIVLEQQLESHRWSIPSSIYADSPVIQTGKAITKEWLVKYLKSLHYTRTNLLLVKTAQYSIQQNGIAFRRRSFSSNGGQTNPIFVAFEPKGVSKIVDLATKQDLPTYELEPVQLTWMFGSQYEARTLVKYQDVPRHLVNAVLAVEDHRFYEHRGIDLKGIARALNANIRGNRRAQGGSTITQQLVKNFYLTSEKSLKRKLNEAVLSIMLERKLTKNQILELYLNEVYLGQRGPVSLKGVSEASRFYFHKDVRNIDIPEAALLAAMIQAPIRNSPYLYKERVTARRNTVLLRMKNSGNLTAEQYKKFISSPVVVQAYDEKISKASYFVDLLSRQLAGKYKADNLQRGDYRVFTTLDSEMQQTAEESVTDGLARIDKIRFKKTGKQAQACLIAIEPSTGFVRAFVGGRNHSVSQFDRLTQAVRQPGSSFKPFVYAAALESFFTSRTENYSPATLVNDAPWELQMTNAVWQPGNYDGRYHGVVSLRNALAKSMNSATARLAEKVGFGRIAALSRDLGFTHIQPYPSLALGAFEVSPWQLIQAYSVLANGGKRLELSTIKKMTDSLGAVLVQHQPQSKNILHPETAYIITDMLRSVITSGTGASVRHWGLSKGIAGKTGTTNDFRDAWFIGYTRDLITLVWTGYDDNTSLNMNGAQAALPIWADFMKKVIKNLPVTEFSVPSGVVKRLIDPTTGKLASETCTNTTEEVFIEGTEPLETCSGYYHSILSDYFTSPEAKFRGLTPETIAVALPPRDVNSEVERFQDQAAYVALRRKPIPFIFTNENISQSESGGKENHE